MELQEGRESDSDGDPNAKVGVTDACKVPEVSESRHEVVVCDGRALIMGNNWLQEKGIINTRR